MLIFGFCRHLIYQSMYYLCRLEVVVDNKEIKKVHNKRVPNCKSYADKNEVILYMIVFWRLWMPVHASKS